MNGKEKTAAVGIICAAAAGVVFGTLYYTRHLIRSIRFKEIKDNADSMANELYDDLDAEDQYDDTVPPYVTDDL